jgi:ergothioneine biosynthesis protein EgtB
MKLKDQAPAAMLRDADASAVAAALRDTRQQTLATFAAYERALGERGFVVPYSGELNPPLWELGHVGWFQEWWLGRNPERDRGVLADPEALRLPPRRPNADALFDSSRVAHDTRWQLPLPGADALRNDLAQGLQETLALLESGPSGEALYFFRLCLFHEDMHNEAAIYMAQHLSLPLRGWAPIAHPAAHEVAIVGGTFSLGTPYGNGFAFDNELGPHDIELKEFQIDSAPVSWARYLPFVEAGGYRERRWWSDTGWQWLQQQALQAPRYLRANGTCWQRQTFGDWVDLDPRKPAVNLSCFEAQAYCAWAGRRLPSEAEWECAAVRAGAAFEWRQVWEWTASAFEPYPGFVAHPYRDYSAPWFHTRRVLRGGSFATHERMKHPRYRNFFPPERNDIFAGLRTCALEP